MKILIGSWNAVSAVKPGAGTGVGGGETRSWNIARGLAQLPDTEVLFCIRVAHSPCRERIDSVEVAFVQEPLLELKQKVLKQVSFTRNIPFLQVHHWSWDLLWQLPVLGFSTLTKSAMKTRISRVRELVKRFAPDVVIGFGVNQESAATVLAARATETPVLLWLRSNSELNPRFFSDPDYQDPYGVTSSHARICLGNVDHVLCQTEHQLKQLAELVSTPGSLIRNPVDLDRFHPGGIPFAARKQVLWVGRYDRFHKRPLIGVEVARACPEIPFLMVINPGDEAVRQEVLKRKPSNVRIVDMVPSNEMPKLIRESRLYVSTGSPEFEGFPNLFLESAASGTPILSLEDFDDFLSRSRAGMSAQGDWQKLAELVRTMWGEEQVWQQASRSGTDYLVQNHALSAIVSQAKLVLDRVIENARGRKPNQFQRRSASADPASR